MFQWNTWTHDDVITWEYFLRYWPFVRGIHRWPANSPHKDQWRGALMFSLIYAWTDDWANNRDAGDLRRHRAHYDVTVMKMGDHSVVVDWRKIRWIMPKPTQPMLVALTHRGRDKMAANFLTTFSTAFFFNDNVRISLTIHWSLFLRAQLTIFQHWFRKWLGADQATSDYLNQWWLDYRCIYASLGLNESNREQNTKHLLNSYYSWAAMLLNG